GEWRFGHSGHGGVKCKSGRQPQISFAFACNGLHIADADLVPTFARLQEKLYDCIEEIETFAWRISGPDRNIKTKGINTVLEGKPKTKQLWALHTHGFDPPGAAFPLRNQLDHEFDGSFGPLLWDERHSGSRTSGAETKSATFPLDEPHHPGQGLKRRMPTATYSSGWYVFLDDAEGVSLITGEPISR
ncbi:unnamed protein product, partial [Mesorhabditis spiculigera]